MTVRKPILILLAASLVILFPSCDFNRYYEKNYPFENQSWERDRLVGFQVDIQDTLSPFNFIINIRHNTDYRYGNIFLFLNTSYPDGNHSRDTLECLLAAPDGEWFGKGAGKIKENQILFKRNVLFPMKGIYDFKFEQAMRVEDLQGMEDFGIRIEKFEE